MSPARPKARPIGDHAQLESPTAARSLTRSMSVSHPKRRVGLVSDNPDRPSLSDLSLVLLNRYEGAKALLAKRLREASQQTKLTTYLTLCVCWWTSSTMTCVSFAALIFISAPNALFNTARWLVIASIAAGLVALAIPWVGFPSLTQEERHRARIRTELLCGVIEIYCVMFAVSLLDTPLDRSDTRSFANMAQHWPTTRSAASPASSRHD